MELFIEKVQFKCIQKITNIPILPIYFEFSVNFGTVAKLKLLLNRVFYYELDECLCLCN